MFKDNNKDTRTAPKVKHSHAGFCYNGLIPERGLPNIYDEAFLAKIVNDEPLTIFAKKSNHRCLTMSRIQLSLSLFLSLSLSLSLSRFQQRLLETKLLESCLPFLRVTFYQHAYMQEPVLFSETHTILSYH